MKPVDLHVHSTCSDGTLSPSGLVDYAMEKGLAAFALTDHDTVEGLDEAIARAQALREKESAAPAGAAVPEVIPGIELSAEYQGQEVHILGLFINYRQPEFRAKLREFADSRTERNRKMCRLLSQAGMDITYEALEREYPDSVITRAHYARYLLAHGYIGSMQEAFERYVGDHCPFYVPREKVTPSQAVELILRAKGCPVFAHPILCRMSDGRLEELVRELKEAGLAGIEAIYSTYKPHEERQIRALAAKYGLLISGGSDFHGDNKPGLDLGTGYGGLFVPEDVLETLRRQV